MMVAGPVARTKSPGTFRMVARNSERCEINRWLSGHLALLRSPDAGERQKLSHQGFHKNLVTHPSQSRACIDM